MAEQGASSGEDRPQRIGRPLSEELTEKVLCAAREVFGEHGLEGFTMAEVERRCGVPKSTIYRRWRSLHALLLEALFSASQGSVPVPDSGSAREDIRMGLRAFVGRLRDPAMLAASQAIVAARMSSASTREALDAVMERDRAALAAVFDKAITRGEELPLPPAMLADLFVSWIVFVGIVQGNPPTDEDVDKVVDGVLR